MTTIPNRPLAKAYDYIVVGAGSGGLPVVRRLIERTDATVLLIEAGDAGIGVPEIEDPTAWVPLGRGRFDWGYDYAPSPLVNNRSIGIPRGKVLGGSSAINALMWYRGNPIDYDAWAEAGCEGWDWGSVLRYFKRAEDWEGGETEYRGSGGPLKIGVSRDLHPVAKAMIDGAPDIGIPVIDDPNGPTNEGAAAANFNIAEGKRFSSVDGYLLPVIDNPRLTVLTGSHVLSLILDGTRCRGIRHLIDGETTESIATSKVILSAGAINTPRILMLSGIGDPAELEPLGIEVRHALRGVGKNLQDHPLVQAIVCRAKRPLGRAKDNGGGSMLNWKSSPSLLQADVHAFPVQGNSAEPRIRELYQTEGDVFSIGAGLMHSKSIGHLKMLSADPFGPLEIQPNYLAEASDLEALVSAVGTIMDLVETPAFKDIFDGFAAPAERLSREETIGFIRNGCSTFFHTSGTARMGRDEDAVVDAHLDVHGLEGLMISDASIIPMIPTCNTHAPVTMIGERAADFLTGAS